MLGEVTTDAEGRNIILHWKDGKDPHQLADLGKKYKNLYNLNPTLYQDDCVDYVNYYHATNIKRWNISTFLKQIGYTQKQVSVEAAQRNHQLRPYHAVEINPSLPEHRLCRGKSTSRNNVQARNLHCSNVQ
ncbi:hypothetical protein G7K_6763-t1 [Saitoella complicata NRRL Y-17804]|uniref:Uncharacterized protein n=1 Tax=Saitoella complicata (strain BCRC 22490 / CBS 7301 / JCM 7358 / NBRC 10748 / NRRL Y-17804) TaxID=698492 RepID=A0A0E9NS29_SAICN|nr:hypothetical protein G7K_6763-t1 [Saitoella complicata NRRL Y-17804]